MSPATTRAVGAVAAGATAVIAFRALWWEPRRVVVRRHTLRLARLPGALDGLRIAALSDLHAGAPHVDEEKLERIVAAVNDAGPDLVALLGDFVDPEVTFGSRVAPEDIAAGLGRLEAPLGVFATLGNHDWDNGGHRVKRALRSHGIAVLENEAVAVRRDGGGELWLVALADLRTRRPDVERAFSEVPDGARPLVLSHDPDLFPDVPRSAALTLAGHTHGGQVDVPLVRRLMIPSRFGDRYAAGHVQEDGKHLFVSRGVGTAGFPVRFRSPPEVALLTLRGGA